MTENKRKYDAERDLFYKSGKIKTANKSSKTTLTVNTQYCYI